MSKKPSYRHHDPKGWCGDPKRGAALGRHAYHEKTYTVRSYAVLRRVRINGDGYDPLGTYWGVGAPLWWCATPNYKIDFCLRATTRKEAEANVRRLYPEINFYKEKRAAT